MAEDQEDVRSLVADILSQSGYTVIEAANGRFALEHLRDDNGTITLVLTDLVMPEMSGQQLFERARGLPRTIPFLFMSGYSEEGVPSSGPNCPALLTKPFTPEQLLQAVRAALSGHAAIARGIHMLTRADALAVTRLPVAPAATVAPRCPSASRASRAVEGFSLQWRHAPDPARR